jgi:hypothetical protein
MACKILQGRNLSAWYHRIEGRKMSQERIVLRLCTSQVTVSKFIIWFYLYLVNLKSCWVPRVACGGVLCNREGCFPAVRPQQAHKVKSFELRYH